MTRTLSQSNAVRHHIYVFVSQVATFLQISDLKFSKHFAFFSACYRSRPSHLSCFVHANNIGEGSILCVFLCPSFSSPLQVPLLCPAQHTAVGVCCAGKQNLYTFVQGGSNMTGTNCDLFTHNQSRSYLNHLVMTDFFLLMWHFFTFRDAVLLQLGCCY
jgi:hypothetical protein